MSEKLDPRNLGDAIRKDIGLGGPGQPGLDTALGNVAGLADLARRQPTQGNDAVSVRLTSYGVGVAGTKTEIEGQEIRNVRDIKFEAPIDEVARLHLEILALEPFEIELPAKVQISFVAYEGCEIVDATSIGDAPGTTRKIVVRRAE